ncbi:YpdA family putative bacillithiol disulfide reductase [Rapidithrix thailandica]|uniref:YpdA family putative bacillithiol disulfide reductase n=1 Tax=Rapidithrix thailandica TaxID=413964 RepID=A0AAW9RZ55_9BACT
MKTKFAMSEKVLDVLIIGGGPIGLACGIAAKKKNLDFLIVEKGCLVNSLYNYPVNMTFFSTSERLEIGGVPFISHGDKPNRTEALEYYRRVQSSWQLPIKLFEKVIEVEKSGTVYTIRTEKATYQAATIIIATGFFDKPNLMGVKGEELPKVKHYYDDPYLYVEQKVLVVGAANSAVDAALQTYRRGAEVIMVVRENEVSERVKYWVRPDIENRIKEGSIQAYFNASVQEIRESEVDILTPEGIVTVKNDFVLAMTGYQPDFRFLEKIGIELDYEGGKVPVHNEETMETNLENMYLAGVICGGMQTSKWFIENSREHADKIIDHIVKKKQEGKAEACV